jgi:hypothetical protein
MDRKLQKKFSSIKRCATIIFESNLSKSMKDNGGIGNGNGGERIRNQGEATSSPWCEEIATPTRLSFVGNTTFSGDTDIRN